MSRWRPLTLALLSAGSLLACSAKDLGEFNAGGGSAGTSGGSSGGATGGVGGATAGAGGATGATGGIGATGGATGGTAGATGGEGGTAGATGGTGGIGGGTGGCVAKATDWMSPTVASNDDAGGTWAPTSSVFMSDDIRATASTFGTGNSKTLVTSGFGFQVPSASKILGIELSVERSASKSSAMRDLTVHLGASGSSVGANRASAEAWPTTDAYIVYGSPSDTWSIPVMPAMVNLPLFEARVTVRCYEQSKCILGVEARIDHVRVRITYEMCN